MPEPLIRVFGACDTEVYIMSDSDETNMPRFMKCPECNEPMMRVYIKSGKKSKTVGLGWICPYHKFVLTLTKDGKTPIYDLQTAREEVQKLVDEALDKAKNKKR